MLRSLLILCVVVLGACSDEIGDSCSLSSDCSSSGERTCDLASPGGYCTIIGCDFDSCPGEAECIRFFTVTESNRTCDPATEDQSEDQCTDDELCSLRGICVPRVAESRYCMRRCDDNDDCRDGYECRDRDLMTAHGGEPVPPPGEAISADPPRFCAPAPISSL